MTQTFIINEGTPSSPTTTSALGCDYSSLVNEVAYYAFGLRPTSTDVITEAVASSAQIYDIQRCISKGLQFVYSAHRWSFLRPLVSITTLPSYSTGTITVNSSGVVAGTDTDFPDYTASDNGWLTIPSVGTYRVSSWTSGVSLTLENFPTDSAFTSSSTYSIGFDSYAMPTGVDSLEGKLTFPRGDTQPCDALIKVSESEIRRLLSRTAIPGRPIYYAETMNTFDPTTGTSRYITFFPVPDSQYTLTAIGTLRPTMIDSTNIYPLGIEVLAPCIAESCLAAAEREIEQKDAGHPDAVHNRALAPLLAMAIQRDKEYSTADTLGVDSGYEGVPVGTRRSPTSRIYWAGGGIADQYI